MHPWNQTVKAVLEPLANAENASFMKATCVTSIPSTVFSLHHEEQL